MLIIFQEVAMANSERDTSRFSQLSLGDVVHCNDATEWQGVMNPLSRPVVFEPFQGWRQDHYMLPPGSRLMALGASMLMVMKLWA